MKPVHRKFLLIALFLSLVALAGMAWLDNWFLPYPPLIKDIKGNITAMNQEFSRRLNEKFPSGTQEGILVQELTSEGFAFEPPARAVFVDRQLVCHFVWTVLWDTNSDTKLSHIEGTFQPACL